jgi:hypothetical protein
MEDTLQVGAKTPSRPRSQLRGEGKSRDGSRWVHVRTDETYIALSPAKQEREKHWIPYQGQPGVNHLAHEVDDVEALSERMKLAGYKDSTPANEERRDPLNRGV